MRLDSYYFNQNGNENSLLAAVQSDENYIDNFNIDINGISSLEDAKNELYDKIFFQLDFEPEFSPSDLEYLETYNPIIWNSITTKLEELETRLFMDCYFEQKHLLEEDINDKAGLMLHMINFITNSVPKVTI